MPDWVQCYHCLEAVDLDVIIRRNDARVPWPERHVSHLSLALLLNRCKGIGLAVSKTLPQSRTIQRYRHGRMRAVKTTALVEIDEKGCES